MKEKSVHFKVTPLIKTKLQKGPWNVFVFLLFLKVAQYNFTNDFVTLLYNFSLNCE